jgi:hypothetical protein
MRDATPVRRLHTAKAMSYLPRLVPTILLTSCLLLVACADDGSDPVPPPPQTFSCHTSLTAIELTYLVNGDMLTLSSNTGSGTLPRVGSAPDPSFPVFGTWHVETDHDPRSGTLSLDMLIAQGKVSALGACDFGGGLTAHARADSPAVITDTSISILQSDDDTQYVTR